MEHRDKKLDSGASIARFTAVVSVFKFICFSLGFVVKFIFPQVASVRFTDAYFWAEESFFNLFTVGEDLLGSSYLPVFVHEKERKGHQSAWKYSGTVLTVQALAALVIVVVGMVFAGHWVDLIGDKLEMPVLARNLLFIFLFGLLFLTLASTLTQNLNAYKKFTLAAFSEFSHKIMSLVFLVGAAILLPRIAGWEGMDDKVANYAMYGTAIGFVVGVFAKFFINLFGLRKQIRQFWYFSGFAKSLKAIIVFALAALGVILIMEWTGLSSTSLLEPEIPFDYRLLVGLGAFFLLSAASFRRSLYGSETPYDRKTPFWLMSLFVAMICAAFYFLPHVMVSFAGGSPAHARVLSAITLVIALIAYAAVDFWGVREKLMQYAWSPAMRSLWLMVLFLLIGSLVGKARDFIELFYKQQVEGVVSYVSYAKQLKEVPMVVFPFALGVVLFPYLSEAVSRDDRKKLVELTMTSMRMMFLFFVPIIIWYAVFGTEIIGVMFYNSENFALDSISASGGILTLYALGFFFYVAEIIVLQTFFSYKDAITPTIVAVFCAGIHVAFLYFFFDRFSYLSFPLAYLISRSAKATILFFLLLPRFKGGLSGELKRWGSFALRGGTAALLGLAAAWGVTVLLPPIDAPDSSVRMTCLVRAVSGAFVATAIPFALFFVFRVPEMATALNVVKAAGRKIAKVVKRNGSS
ncbi:MAG: lipid II flippase MurJ [Planctomycetota bacterium]|nr:lipid II flippase MurJ [Planctomycetota bacterium]